MFAKDEKSERLIPTGTQDSSALSRADEKRLNKRKSSSSPAKDVKTSLTASSSGNAREGKMQQQQQQSQNSASPSWSLYKNSTVSPKTTGGPTRKAQVEQYTDGEESYVYEEKKGHKLCCFLCDSKRAVLIVCCINFFIVGLSMTRNWKNAQGNGTPFDFSNDFTKAFITQGCSVFVDITTMIGALWYSVAIVAVGFIFKCYQLVVSTMSAVENWQGGNTEFIATVSILGGFNLMSLYAAAVFMWEVHKGILTKDTYQKREKYSCCCEC